MQFCLCCFGLTSPYWLDAFFLHQIYILSNFSIVFIFVFLISSTLVHQNMNAIVIIFQVFSYFIVRLFHVLLIFSLYLMIIYSIQINLLSSKVFFIKKINLLEKLIGIHLSFFVKTFLCCIICLTSFILILNCSC